MGRAHQLRGSDWTFVATSENASSGLQQEIPASTELKGFTLRGRASARERPETPSTQILFPRLGRRSIGRSRARSLRSPSLACS